jgi:hypothetical protein
LASIENELSASLCFWRRLDRTFFAIGDVRSGSTMRVASAVGDDALVVRSMHEALNRRRGAVE